MVILEKYFPGQSCGNKECERQGIKFCNILVKNIFLQKEDISRIAAKQMIFPSICPVLKNPSNGNTCRFHPLLPQTLEIYADRNGRKIIGKKYITDADASKEGACKKCLEYANRIFKIPEEAHLMPKLPQHPNCKCRYEDVYAPENEKEFQKEIEQLAAKYVKIKSKIQKDVEFYTSQTFNLIKKMKRATSFTEYIEFRHELRPIINKFSAKINLRINELKGELHIFDFYLDYIAQIIPFKVVKEEIYNSKESIKNVMDIYEIMKDMHYKRLSMVMQQTRYLPKNPKEARSEEAQKEGWKKASENENWYHRNNGKLLNVKYYNTKTGQEAIYESDRDNAKLVTSVDNFGTFNHFPPNKALQHMVFDVIPYWLWGNSIDDTTPLGNRITGN